MFVTDSCPTLLDNRVLALIFAMNSIKPIQLSLQQHEVVAGQQVKLAVHVKQPFVHDGVTITVKGREKISILSGKKGCTEDIFHQEKVVTKDQGYIAYVVDTQEEYSGYHFAFDVPETSTGKADISCYIEVSTLSPTPLHAKLNAFPSPRLAAVEVQKLPVSAVGTQVLKEPDEERLVDPPLIHRLHHDLQAAYVLSVVDDNGEEHFVPGEVDPPGRRRRRQRSKSTRYLPREFLE